MSDISDKNSKIYLIGTDNSLNGALSYVFEREICSQCVILKKGSSFPVDEATSDNKNIIFLIDGLERDFEKELIGLPLGELSRNEKTTVALFNLQKGTWVERRAFKKGIKGFFYRDDSLAHMLKGLRSLLKGEIWVSREILAEIALQSRTKIEHEVHEKADLSRRETEILALLSIGSSNDDIADKLFISPNTVKTHLYRIFRKIKVPNRFQAALWAAKNL
jgi:DNA-binding CsgD family transcriptional regulator